MSDTAIRVEGLSKQFRIGSPERYRTLRDTLTDTLTAPFRFLRYGGSANAPAETIWALRDVSFDVKVGEVVGIIGRNGSGKSTLLKILSRITEPTDGRAEIHGRVGSLLEVGTGFHPELTGRENVFLNGAILGMNRGEIQHKFNEIVAFSEVDKFIDTPVKHYSSGMYLRLAFAVAAHMEPEILIIDEVLAVGDAAFQKKCLGKMSDVAGEGRTVLFVSHNLDAVARICDRAVLLDKGAIQEIGDCASVISRYQGFGQEPLHPCSFQLGDANFIASLVLNYRVASTSQLEFSLMLTCDTTIRMSELALILETTNGQRIGLIDFRSSQLGDEIQGFVDNEFAVEIDNFDLVAADISMKLWVNAAGSSADIDLGHTFIRSSLPHSSYLTAYTDDINGITKFRGSVRHLTREVAKQ